MDAASCGVVQLGASTLRRGRNDRQRTRGGSLEKRLPVAMAKSPLMATKKSPPLDVIHDPGDAPGSHSGGVRHTACDPEARPL